VANRYGHALALVRARQPRTAIAEFKQLTEDFPDNLTFMLGLAHAEDQAGQKDSAFSRAAEAYAEWAYLNGRVEDALNQLKALSSKPELTYYQRARVEARITAMTPAVLDIRKSERRQPDADGARENTQLSLCPQQQCLDLSRRRNIAPLQ